MAASRTDPRETDPKSGPRPDEPVVSPPAIEVKNPRERIDVVLRFCQEDDPFVVDWAPPQT